jgi:predicted dehydrogenase
MTDPRAPRAAIIGAGLMGRWHADAVRRIGGRVAVIVDPSERARLALGRRYPEAQLADSLDPSLVARTANAAHVCSPLPTHAPLVHALVDAGVSVLVEKPFAENADVTRTLVEHAATRQVVVCPVHQFLFQDGVRQIRGWLPSLGTIRRIEFSACSAGAGAGDVIGFDDLIAEILPHPLSIVSLLLDRVIGGTAWQVVRPSAGEFYAVASLGEAVVTIGISAHARPTENFVRVLADGGAVIADLYHGFAVKHTGDGSRRAKIARPFATSLELLSAASANLARRAMRSEPAYPGLRQLVRQFYAAVRSEGAAPILPNEILDVAEGRDALLAGPASVSWSGS